MNKFILGTLVVLMIPYNTYRVKPVSIFNLITTPEKYDNEQVEVSGYFSNDFENTRLFIDKASSEYRMEENSVSVFFDSTVRLKQLKSYDNRYIRLKGIFHKAPPGNYNTFTNYIDKIYELDTLKRFDAKDPKW